MITVLFDSRVNVFIEASSVEQSFNSRSENERTRQIARVTFHNLMAELFEVNAVCLAAVQCAVTYNQPTGVVVYVYTHRLAHFRSSPRSSSIAVQ